MKRAIMIVCAVACTVPVAARAWEPETHVGLTHGAALRSHLDGWLRHAGFDDGLYETLGLQPARDARDPDRELIDELDLLDASLGVSPDSARQPALYWLLGGAALEGARIDRLRNHFFDPKGGGGLHEAGAESERLRLDAARDGSGSVRGIFTGANFDGTGIRADRWLDSNDNGFSRTRMLDALERSATAPTPVARGAALARALVCMGSIEHVLQSVGDPAHARGDFTVNYVIAGAPFERWAAARYGRSVPAPSLSTPAPSTLTAFLTAVDGSGLADEVGRAFVSPGTLPGMPGALPSPALVLGREPQGIIGGEKVRELAAYHRTARGTSITIPAEAVAQTVDALLPRIERRSVQLLDWLLRGELATDTDGTFKVGALGLGRGKITYLEDGVDGQRHRILDRETPGGAPGTTLFTGDRAARGVLVYRGVDDKGEPIVLIARGASGS